MPTSSHHKEKRKRSHLLGINFAARGRRTERSGSKPAAQVLLATLATVSANRNAIKKDTELILENRCSPFDIVAQMSYCQHWPYQGILSNGQRGPSCKFSIVLSQEPMSTNYLGNMNCSSHGFSNDWVLA